MQVVSAVSMMYPSSYLELYRGDAAGGVGPPHLPHETFPGMQSIDTGNFLRLSGIIDCSFWR